MCARLVPALVPAVGLVTGVVLGGRLGEPRVPAQVALVAVGSALGGPVGSAVTCLAIGLLRGSLHRSASAGPGPSLIDDRPVTASIERIGPWQRGEWTWRASARTRWVRQGHAVWSWRTDVDLVLPRAVEPPYGRHLTARGALRHRRASANGLRAPPVRRTLYVKSSRLIDAPQGIARERGGDALRAAIDRRLDVPEHRSPGGWLVAAFVLGEGWRAPERWRLGFRRTGLGHLLALSGLHVALVALPVAVAVAGLGGRRVLAAVGGLAAGGLYLAVVGPAISLQRSLAMAAFAALALALRRAVDGRSTWLLAVSALAFARPTAALELGFQLSAAATGGLVWLMPAAHGRRTASRRLRRAVAATLTAQLCTLPFVWSAYRVLHLVSFLLNLVAIPWLSLTLLVCCAWVVAALSELPAAATALLWTLDRLARPVEWLTLGPPAVVVLPIASGELWRLMTTALLLALSMALFRRRSGPSSLAALAVAAVVGLGGDTGDAGPRVEAVFVDVGQGDAIVLRDGGAAVMIDGGGWRGGNIAGSLLLPALVELGIRSLDAVVVSHEDLDHCGGLVGVVALMPVRELWLAPGWLPGGCAERLVTSSRAKLRPLWAGDRRTVGRWRLDVLHPAAGARRRGNDGSVVVRASVLGRRFLLPGDLEAAGEARLLARYGGEGLRSDLLKVGHHGSTTSTSSAWLTAIDPPIAVISAGAGNRFGHPAAQVLERLTGRLVLRTDRLGMIRVRIEDDGRLGLGLPGLSRDRE